ncbi:MAG: hypothetical protein NTY04_03545 [Candidatus Staskawiczbacteria bacterium]|nr:hypothetical protein [Candidatus Staskawiczbacteria bacterium]
MEQETKQCQNCKKDFIIEPEDFTFYEKIKVPAPTFCFLCRVQRRMAYRNERMLYKRACNASGHTEQIMSVFSPDNLQCVYDHTAWWGNTWDGTTYGREYDFSKPFFEQLQKLWRQVPDVALLNINPVNSEYCSITEGNKNCYFLFGADFNENSLYSTYIFNSKECVDTYWVTKSEFNYETVDCISCSKLQYGRYCEECYNSAFLFNCRNCHDCFGCVNLKNGAYCIFNKQYTKEEYNEKLKEFDIQSASRVTEIKEQFLKFSLSFPRRFARMVHVTNSSGDNLQETKNCKHCFDVFGGAEDCTNLWLAYSKASDCMDVDRVGLGTELGYDCSTIYPGSLIFFSRFIFNSHDVYYSYNVHNCSYVFGCIGLRNKQYCIFNKQYSESEYNRVISEIIAHMDKMPYIDKAGCIYKFGEFFPIQISPFAYNETIAQEMFPLSKEEALAQGFNWREQQERNYTPTKIASELPDRVADVSDNICSEIIECAHKGKCADQCTTAFKITPVELQFYKQMKIPLPRLCPNCRHFARVRQRNPIQLWKRKCQCGGDKSVNGAYSNASMHSHGTSGCTNEFETSYSPDRSEIVYCESCYQQEVV